MSESSTVYQFVDTNGDWPYNIHVEGCRGAKEARYSAKHHNLTPNEVAQNSYHVLFDNSSLPRFEGNTFADLETSLVRIHNCLTADMKREIKSATFTRMSPKEEEALYDYQGNAESFAADGPFVCSECSAFGVNDLRPEDEMCSACLKLGQFYCFDCCAENHAESFSAETCREGCGNEIHCVDCRLCGDCHATGSMCKDCREDICPKDVNAWQLNDKSWLCYDCQHNYPESHESFGAEDVSEDGESRGLRCQNPKCIQGNAYFDKLYQFAGHKGLCKHCHSAYSDAWDAESFAGESFGNMKYSHDEAWPTGYMCYECDNESIVQATLCRDCGSDDCCDAEDISWCENCGKLHQWDGLPDLLEDGSAPPFSSWFQAESFAAWKRHPTTGAIRYGTRELFDLQSDLAKMGLPTSGNVRKLKERKRRYRDWDAESFNAEGLLFTPYENTKSDKRIRMNISQEDMATFDKLPSQQNQQTITIKNLKNGEKYVVRRADCGAGCYCAAEVVRILKPREKTFNAPYAGAGALMPIKGDTALSSFSGKELAQSSAIHGDFNQASINYSGHQNLEVRGAEENRFPYPEAQVTNIVRVKDKVYVTIRYPDTDEYYGYEKILVGDMEDVMLAESFEAHGIGSDEKCDYCELPMDYCERLRGVKHSPREGGIGRYKLDCHQCGEMYESCPECDGDICFDCHNDICIFCGCNTLKYAAESFGAEYGKRQRFGNRYVARNTKGEFISNVGVGASLKADRRNKSKTPARSGFGNRGDSQKGVVVDSSGKSLVGLGLLVGGVWALLDSRGTQSIK